MTRLRAAALLMTVAVSLSTILGLVRYQYVAARFGAVASTDAFINAFTIPDWLNYLVAGGTLSITLLPIYAKHLVAGDEAEANRALSVIATMVTLVVIVGVLAGEIFAAPISRWFFKDMSPASLTACVRYTRILLPAQLCFVLGSIFSATLYARTRFRAAAFAPLFYNAGIIIGGIVGGDRLGIESLVWGALVGAFVGPLMVPLVAALRAGARVVPSLALRHPSFRAWLWQSLPLMIGVSLVSADEWLQRHFGSGVIGAVSHLSFAKRLVMVPITIAGQAVGQASMPFFARLFSEGKKDELAETVTRTLRGAGAAALLLGAGVVALAAPIVGVMLRHGAFHASDVDLTATYLTVFGAAIPLWVLQGLMARTFYASSNTLVPMIAGTVVTVASYPVYAWGFRSHGVVGLAAASSVGILLHTVVLALLLPRILPELRSRLRGLVGGLLRAWLLALLAGGAAWVGALAVGKVLHAGPLLRDLGRLGGGGAVFVVVALVGARLLGVSELDRLIARLGLRRGRAG
jgi:putative peptidoglycan lipid II flippase